MHAAAKKPAPSLWDFGAHFRSLLPHPSPLGSASSSAFMPTLSSSYVPCADGVRALLSLAMIAYHAQSFLLPHVEMAPSVPFFNHWAVWAVGLGPVIVEWFFVLTGFLTALPLLQDEKRALQAMRDEADADGDANADADAPLLSFSVSSSYYRRLSRLLPCWLLLYAVHHWINRSMTFTATSLRNEGYLHLFESLPPELQRADGINSLCQQPLLLPLQLTLLMHFLPFGGCQGVTWSMGVQAQFWLFFPPLWGWLVRGTKKAAVTAGTQSPPGVRLLRWMWAVVAVCVAFRVMAFFHICTAPMAHFEGAVIFFFWYSQTVTRMGAMAAGVLLAYYCTNSSLPQALHTRRWLRVLLVAAHLLLLAAIRWTTIAPQEGPAMTVLARSQLLIPMTVKSEQHFPPSLQQLANLPRYAVPFVFQTLLHVGSPGMALLICATLMMLVHRVDACWAAASRALSSPWLQPVATLSYLMYMLHPTLEQQWFMYFTDHVDPHWVPTVRIYLTHTAALTAVTVLLATALHVVYDAPMQALLKGWKAGRTWVSRYALLCMAMSALVHCVGLPVLLFGYNPKEDAIWEKEKMKAILERAHLIPAETAGMFNGTSG